MFNNNKIFNTSFIGVNITDESLRYTSFLFNIKRKEVAINNPEIKVYKHEINISGLLIDLF